MLTRAWRLRLATMVAAGALAVHELRYLIAPEAGSELQSHGYLVALAPALLIALLFAAWDFVTRLGPVRCAAKAPATARLWATSSSSLLAVYALQESLECSSAVHGGNLPGVGALLAGGGWLAIPLSLAVGLAIALLLRGGVTAERRVARRGVRSRPLAPCLAVAAPAEATTPRGPISRHLAARGPPLAASRFSFQVIGALRS